MRRPTPLALLGVVACLGSGAGCGKHEAPAAKPGSTSPTAPSPATDSAPASHTGVVEGIVRLAEGYELPSYTDDQLEKKVLTQTERASTPETCSPPRTTDRQPVLAGEGGGLSNIVLAASQFSRNVQRSARVHEVAIEDCRLTPKVVVAVKGDVLRVRNTMTYPFMPTFNQDGMARTLLPGQTYDVPLDRPMVQPLLCGFTAPCGRTDVVVMLHPISAVSDSNGKFRFDAFPADESVVLSAWHPLFEEAKLQVRIGSGEHKTVELVLTPRVKVAPHAAPATPPPTAPVAPPPGKPAKPPAAH